jgi:hypothetical protein
MFGNTAHSQWGNTKHMATVHCFKSDLLFKTTAGYNICVILIHFSSLKHIMQSCYRSYAVLLPECLLTSHLCTSSNSLYSMNRTVLELHKST